MTKLTPSLLVASLLALSLSTAPAHALNTRSFISANGNDANPCTRPLPCRTLQIAHNNTAAGGEINMLDPAGYGTVIITKSISIVNDGVGSAGILVPNLGIGITINAGANDEINLRGLIIEGAGVGQDGIRFNTGGALTIENSVIRGMMALGIGFQPTLMSSLAVSNTLIANNNGVAVRIMPGGGLGPKMKAVFSRVEMHNNGTGIVVAGGESTVSVVDSVASNNSIGAFEATASFPFSAVSLLLLRSVAVNNGIGASAAGNRATIRLAQSALTDNSTGFQQTNGGVIETFGDNYIAGNGANIGVLTPISKQ